MKCIGPTLFICMPTMYMVTIITRLEQACVVLCIVCAVLSCVVCLFLCCSIMCMIVENTFTGIPSMAQLMFPGVSIFPYFCFKNKVSHLQGAEIVS